ncbi:radical SAM protein [candidate division WOR-3 bacterium]|nr:radical SAM protein [candidate division WOR-3 bacterium]
MPHKICSFDCIYCQLGRTTGKTVARKDYTPVHEILDDVRLALQSKEQINYLTFAGSGEPTLHKSVGHLIAEAKKMTDIPVAVLTNGSMLIFPDVRNDLVNADVVIPTLCTTDQSIFERIHRPHACIEIEEVIRGYIEFRRIFKGRIWLEVMLMKDVNDKPEQIKELRTVIEKIAPDKIHLNTVVRPPSEEYAKPVDVEMLRRISEMLGEKAEVIADFSRQKTQPSQDEHAGSILSMIRRRPITINDLVSTLGLHENEIIKIIEHLIAQKEIAVSRHDGKDYYEVRRRSND